MLVVVWCVLFFFFFFKQKTAYEIVDCDWSSDVCSSVLPVSYSDSPIGEQKRLEQTPQRYGNRISILGLWQPAQGFEYALAQGGFKSKSYIEVMDWVAQKAAQTLAETGRITVIVQDNGSLHKSRLVQQQIGRASCRERV